MKKMFAFSLISFLLPLPASTLAQAPTPKKAPPLPPEFRLYRVAMWILGLAIVLLLGVASPAAAQTGRLGTPNLDRDGTILKRPVFILPLPGGGFMFVPPGTPGSRETIPFNNEPHRFNNPHPMLPNAGLGYALQYVQVPAQQVVLQVYVPGPGSFPGEFQSQAVEIPGYMIVETTTGYFYRARWGLQQVTTGVYQWVTLPQQFQPK